MSTFFPGENEGEQTSLIGKTFRNAPIINRIFGGTHMFRTQQLFEKNASNGSSENGALKSVLEELEKSSRVSKRYIMLGVLLMLTHLAYGVIAMMLLEDWTAYDAVYFVIVTLTTVGYGDLYPTTDKSKIFVIGYALVSICIVSSYLGYFVGLFLDRQETLLLETIMDGDPDEEEDGADLAPKERIIRATEGVGETEVRSMGYSGVLITIVLISGVCMFKYMEELSLLDSIYATVISSTTIGYGDISPTNEKTKKYMTVWLILSTITLAKVVSDFTDLRLQAKEKAVARRVLTATFDKKSLKHIDANDDGVVSWGEYLAAMVVTLEKMTQEEVDTIKTRFNQMDRNKDGLIKDSEIRNQR